VWLEVLLMGLWMVLAKMDFMVWLSMAWAGRWWRSAGPMLA